MSLLPFVNPLQGTYSQYQFSTGNTLPIVAMPYGMAHWTLQTDNVRGWYFNPLTPKVQGIRCTHQPSPWMGDYGAFTILPQTGKRLLSAQKRANAYRLDKTTLKPHLLSVELLHSGTHFSLVPTTRGAIVKVDFAKSDERRLIFEGVKGETSFTVLEDKRTILGYTRGNSGGVPEGFAHYFVAVLDCEIESSQCFIENDLVEEAIGEGLGLSVELGQGEGSVTLRLATSFISHVQALLNLEQEILERSFRELLDQSRETWEDLLGTIQIEGATEEQKQTFYSCFYRTKLFPRVWHEVNAEGETMHYSPYDGAVHPGPLYADTGFWDTYRTLFPLMTVLEPDRHTEILAGFVNAYHESGWLPQWPSPGHRVCMPGTHLDVTIADAVAKGLDGFDVSAALDGMVKHANNPVGDGPYGAGRDNIQEYLDHGYVLATSHASVSQSLDYAYDDWCIAQVATSLGNSEIANQMNARATNYEKLWDASVGFMRARHADGSWNSPFDPVGWGGPYCEGGPWQSSWAVQHDFEGLIKLVGGNEAMVAKLDEMLASPPRFNCDGYSQEIHEITEMAVADFGQYAHSNQPVHHVLFLYHAAGRPDRMQFETRRVLEDYYKPTTLPGDEDNGEMCAWYVLCSLGFYPACPGRAEYVLTSPLFKRATVQLPGGNPLTVLAHGDGRYVSAVLFNGVALMGGVISHAELAGGGTLDFMMSQEAVL